MDEVAADTVARPRFNLLLLGGFATVALLLAGLGLTTLGLVVGLGIALAATRLMAGLLYGIDATDPATLLGVVGFLLLVSLLASYLPGRRAARVDPAISLRAG